MPNVLIVLGYKVYFWTNENNEPIHVHISKGKPNGNATKVWITSTGGLVVHNTSGIPKDDLIKILSCIRANILLITSLWISYFGSLTYMC